MFLLKKLLGDSNISEDIAPASSLVESSVRKGKRFLSGDPTSIECGQKGTVSSSHSKKKSLQKMDAVSQHDSSWDCAQSDDDSVPGNENTPGAKLPAETPDWGIKLLEIIQGEFKSVKDQIASVDLKNNDNATDIKLMLAKLEKMEVQNHDLVTENVALRE